MGTYNIGRDQDVFMVKTDIRLNDANQLVLRFNQQNFTGNNNENGGPLSVEEHSGNSVAKTTTFSGSLTSTLTPRLSTSFVFSLAATASRAKQTATSLRRAFKPAAAFCSWDETTSARAKPRSSACSSSTSMSLHARRAQLEIWRRFELRSDIQFLPRFVFSGQYTFNSYALFASNTPASLHAEFCRRRILRAARRIRT